MKFKLITYIRIDSEEEPVFNSLQEALQEKTHHELLQPENIYKIEEVED